MAAAAAREAPIRLPPAWQRDARGMDTHVTARRCPLLAPHALRPWWAHCVRGGRSRQRMHAFVRRSVALRTRARCELCVRAQRGRTLRRLGRGRGAGQQLCEEHTRHSAFSACVAACFPRAVPASQPANTPSAVSDTYSARRKQPASTSSARRVSNAQRSARVRHHAYCAPSHAALRARLAPRAVATVRRRSCSSCSATRACRCTCPSPARRIPAPLGEAHGHQQQRAAVGRWRGAARVCKRGCGHRHKRKRGLQKRLCRTFLLGPPLSGNRIGTPQVNGNYRSPILGWPQAGDIGRHAAWPKLASDSGAS